MTAKFRSEKEIRFKSQPLKTFLYWITEREHIRKLKEGGAKKPWTEDEIFMDNRFCNVRRMDDKVSRWLLKNWYNHKADDRTILLMACLARLLNRLETLENLDMLAGAKTLEPKQTLNFVRKMLHARQRRGESVFTGVYIVNGRKGMSKIDYVTQNIGHAVQQFSFGSTMRDLWGNLQETRGLGSFTAGQITADIRFVCKHWNPSDTMTWAPLGPGSRRGSEKLIGKKPTQKEFDFMLPKLVQTVYDKLPEIASDRKLEAMDVQNCLCEFDKYTRVQAGGEMRTHYNGRGEEQ